MKPHILIIGFGETGLLTATYLNHYYPGQFKITAISNKPALLSGQELGTRISKTEFWKRYYLRSFNEYGHLENIDIIHAQFNQLDTEANTAHFKRFKNTDSETISYDYAVIATGVSNGFWRNGQLESKDDINQQLDHYQELFSSHDTIAVVGGGPAGVSASYNLKIQHPNKEIHFFFDKDLPLPQHAPTTRKKVMQALLDAKVHCHSHHRLDVSQSSSDTINHDNLYWQKSIANRQTPAAFQADLNLITIGQSKPNNHGLPQELLNQAGFVNTNKYLQCPKASNVFCVGDIAETDPLRSSARNGAYKLLAKNIYKAHKQRKLKPYKASTHRWGSVIGVQNDGLKVFTPKGHTFRFPAWSIESILYPKLVDQGIYKKTARLKNKIRADRE